MGLSQSQYLCSQIPSYMHPSLSALRDFYHTGTTRSFEFRREQLKKLKKVILNHEAEINKALYADLKKSPEEVWATEIGLVIAEINTALNSLKKWMRPQRVPTNLLNFPSTSKIIYEPLGLVLIIAPWNYPFQLSLNPLVAAIAAGNTVVLKPSEFAPATARVIATILSEAFPPNYVFSVEGDGGVVVSELMHSFRFDHVFYTGSTAVGQKIYSMAAEKLIPVTLELGGKSPCVVESDAQVDVAARRIVLTKFNNAGQMCVAPDFLLVHEKKYDEMIDRLKFYIEQFFTDQPKHSSDYGRIIHSRQFARLRAYLEQGTIEYGGDVDESDNYMAPTLLVNVSPEAPMMQEEIFGPLLPIFSFSHQEEALKIIERNNNPLAFYLFTSSTKTEQDWLNKVSFGGGCKNNCAWHLTNHHLPFGGRGNSGIGSYHGKYGFETFSHRKAWMSTPLWFDPSLKYPPFKGRLSLMKKLFR